MNKTSAARTAARSILGVVAVIAVLPPTVAPGASGQVPGGVSVAGPDDDGMVPVDVASVGVDLHTGTPIALLHDRDWDEVLPIWIGDAEAQAIARVLQGVEMPRPMTHDLLASMIGELGGTVEEVVVHSIEESTYIGTVRIRVGGGEDSTLKEVDSRPSDGLALALRTGATIRVNPDFFEETPDVDFLATEAGHTIVRTHGVTVGRVTSELAAEFGLPDDREGVAVLSVTDEVATRGLRRGDLIVDVNGQVPEEPVEFLESVVRDSPSEGVRLVYYRDGEEELVTLPRREGPAAETQPQTD